MNTQKLVILTLVLSFIVSNILIFANNPDDYSMTTLVNESNNNIIGRASHAISDYQQEDTGAWSSIKATISMIYENTIGNAISMGLTILNLFFASLNPFVNFPETSYDTLEQIGITIIYILRALIAGLLILEAYLIFKNKKSR